VRTTSTSYKRGERKILPQPFTACIVDMHPYKNILLPRYRVPQKNCLVRKGSAKIGGQCDILCSAKRNYAMQFKKCFGGFYRG